MGIEKRRERRYRFQLPVTLVRGQKTTALLTGDVSYRGVLLRTDAPPPLRQLLLLRFQLPPDGGQFEIQGMSVWNVAPTTENRTPGVGVQFYAVSTAAQRRWEEFIRWVMKHHPETEERTVVAAAGAPDPVRRLHERVVVELRVKLETAQDLHVLSTRDVSRGGMFVRTALALEVGAEVKLNVIHPATGATFPIAAIVRRRVSDPSRAGIGVEFVRLGEKQRDEFMAFASAALAPPGPEEAVYVASDDPLLA